jgi:hypothetical protein
MLEGAVAANMGKVRLYKELNFPVGYLHEKEFDQRGENPKTKNQVGKYILDNHTLPGTPVEQRDVQRFVDAARGPEVSFRIMNWLNPDRRDMTRFVQDREFAIAWTGAAHALRKLYPDPNERDLVTEPWLGEFGVDTVTKTIRNVAMLPPALHESAVMTRAAQEDMCDGAARSQEAGPTALVLSSSIWSSREIGEGAAEPEGRVLGPLEKRARFIRHYNSKGFAVMEVPFAEGLNATMVVPGQYLPQLRQFVADHPDHIRLFCHGLPGGAPAPIHDEL